MTALHESLATAEETSGLAPDLDELAEAAARFESAPATASIEWAAERFHGNFVLAASFQDCVLIDLAVQVVPDVEVVFLDTQYHFAETLWYVEAVKARYDLNLTTTSPEVPRDDRWLADPDACCRVRKVEPMAKALAGKDAWMTGLRRTETSGRVKTPVVHYDLARGLVKVNPIATWTDEDVAGYIRDRDLPVHPLSERGYQSIGCWPCTRPVTEGENARDGRWAGSDKIECGLH
jgi:phosphoadenosine phosphosulfate reductase